MLKNGKLAINSRLRLIKWTNLSIERFDFKILVIHEDVQHLHGKSIMIAYALKILINY